jgi:two-component system phosphate regulon sensor histidine kinase PhoR
LSNQAEQSARALPSGLFPRAGQVVRRGLRGLSARLWTSLWLIVIVAVIMASLVALGNLTVGLALTAFVAFVASVALLPRQEVDPVLENDLGHSPAAVRSASAMHVMAETLPDPVILLNRAGQVLSLNGPARGLFAALREGSHISSVIRTPEFLDAVSAAPRRGRAVTVTYAERVPVGRRMAVTVAPLSRGPDREGNILVLLRDLTEVERINQMRADFIANASHELRTPLASLRGFIETLQGTAKDDPGARERFLPIMAEQASRMTRLIDALLSLSRVEMNAHVLPSDLVDLNDVLGHAGDTLEPLASDSGISLEVGPSESRLSSAATATSCCKSCRTSCRTRSNTATSAAMCASRRSTSPPSGAKQRAATPSAWWMTDPASRRSICRGLPSASTGSMWPRAARRAAPGSASPSLSTF